VEYAGDPNSAAIKMIFFKFSDALRPRLFSLIR
jgi:hypothetical protein